MSSIGNYTGATPALIDTHAHLDSPKFDGDRAQVIARARQAGIARIINVGADLPSSHQAAALAHDYPDIYASVGVHPHDAKSMDNQVLAEIAALADKAKVVAIGEIGLDYHYDFSPRPAQRQAFSQQLALARQLHLPIIVHDREAHADTLAMLREWAAGIAAPAGVLHCFSGDVQMAQAVIELGLYLGVDGPVTYKNARQTIEVVRHVPLERLLIETDCPYLTPHPYRGKRNEPAYVRHVAERIAELRDEPLEWVADVTTKNARRLFGLESGT